MTTMKPAQQWVVDPKRKFLMCQTFDIEAVQLDAWKQGMRDAAAIAEDAGYKHTPRDVRRTILHKMTERESI